VTACRPQEGNGLIELPPDLQRLDELQQLHVGGNRLASLPHELRGLTALRLLAAPNNQLQVGRQAGRQVSFVGRQLATWAGRLVELGGCDCLCANVPCPCLVASYALPTSCSQPASLSVRHMVVSEQVSPFNV
jgi:hypothetical protein